MTQSVFSVGDRVQHRRNLYGEFTSFNNWQKEFNGGKVLLEFTIVKIEKSEVSGFRLWFKEIPGFWWKDRRFEHSTQIVDLDDDDQDCI